MKGLWILPEIWKTPHASLTRFQILPGRFPHLLGRATPDHRLHSPGGGSTTAQSRKGGSNS